MDVVLLPTPLFTLFLLPKRTMKQNKGIFSKWIIEGIEGYVFGSDMNLYRLPFKSGRNHFGLRKLKEQPSNRWKIKGKWMSKTQLFDKTKLNPNPEILIRDEESPF